MNIVRLGDVCKVISGSTPKREIAEYWDGTIPWVTPKEISRLASPFLWESAEKITEAGFKSCSTAMLPVDSLLLSSRAPIGLLAINKISVCTNQGFKSLIPSKEVNVEYLYYVLKASVSCLQARGNGATFKELAKPTVENFEIPLPTLDDQIRIAHLLGKVEGLIAQRKQHLQQLDNLLKSVFLEMFGDPVRNEKGWNEYPLSKQCQKITDGTHDTPEKLTKGVPFITGKHIRPYSIDYSGCDFVSAEDHSAIYSRCDPKYGDILYTNIGVNLGTAAMNTVRFEFSMKNVALLRPSVQLNSRFLEHYLNFEKVKAKIISDLSSGGAQKFLGLGQIKKIVIVIPPKPLQNHFAEIVEKVESIKARYQKSLIDLEALYGALSQLAFKSELDLSRIEIPQSSPAEALPEETLPAMDSPMTTLIELPELPAELTLSGKGRRAALQYWFQAAMKAVPKGGTLQIEKLIDAINFRLIVMDDQDFEFASADYEVLKLWIFEAIASGTLTQVFDDVGNRIQLKAMQA